MQLNVEVKIAYQYRGLIGKYFFSQKSTDAGLEPAASCSEDKRSTIELAGRCQFL
jgi:hypothetical protein